MFHGSVFPEEVFSVHVASVVKKGLVDCIVVRGVRRWDEFESFGKEVGGGFG